MMEGPQEGRGDSRSQSALLSFRPPAWVGLPATPLSGSHEGISGYIFETEILAAQISLVFAHKSILSNQ